MLSRGIRSVLDSVRTERAWRRIRQIHLLASRLLLGAVAWQIALGIIKLPIHQVTGVVAGLLSLIVAIAAVRGRFSRSTIGLSVACCVLVGLQGLLILLAGTVPVFTIFHLIGGFVIFGFALVIAIESEDEGRNDNLETPLRNESPFPDHPPERTGR